MSPKEGGDRKRVNDNPAVLWLKALHPDSTLISAGLDYRHAFAYLEHASEGLASQVETLKSVGLDGLKVRGEGALLPAENICPLPEQRKAQVTYDKVRSPEASENQIFARLARMMAPWDLLAGPRRQPWRGR